MRLRYTRRALRQLFAVLDYIERRSPRSAASIARRLEETIAILKVQPEIGAPTQRARFRRFILRPYPYAVINEATPTNLIVNSVRHLARRS